MTMLSTTSGVPFDVSDAAGATTVAAPVAAFTRTISLPPPAAGRKSK